MVGNRYFHLTELSFCDVVFPTTTCYKIAMFSPLLKKKTLDRDDVANYRPTSNHHMILKIVERLLLSRISSHIKQLPCFNTFQSAYRHGYLTETTLKLTNDVYVAGDNAYWFNDHKHCRILQMIWSYISGRSQFVRLGGCRYKITACKYGVPQGSVLSPLIFTVHCAGRQRHQVVWCHVFSVCWRHSTLPDAARCQPTVTDVLQCWGPIHECRSHVRVAKRLQSTSHVRYDLFTKRLTKLRPVARAITYATSYIHSSKLLSPTSKWEWLQMKVSFNCL